MNGRERMIAALRFEEADCVAVNPEVIQHSLEISGIKHSRYSQDAETMAQAQLACRNFYDYDSIYVSSDNYVLCEAFGGELRFPDDEPPQLIRIPFRDNDVASLKAVKPESGRVGVILKATELCKKKSGNEFFVKTCIDSAPFSAAAAAAGTEQFLMALMDEEDWVDDLLNFCTEQIIQFGMLAAESGADGLAFGDSVSAMVGRELYKTAAFPYAKKAISALKEQTGLPVFYHVCGNTNHILDLFFETGADCIEIDSMVDMAEAKKASGGRCCLEGNVSTIDALLNGTPKDVRLESDRIINLFGSKGGLILSGACEIPRHTPRENLAEMIAAARA